MPRKGWPLAPAVGGCGLDGAWRSAEVCHQEIDGEVWPRCNFKPLVFSQFRTAVDKPSRMGHDPGGFGLRWRQLTGSDATLDNAHVAEDYLARTTTMYRIIAVGRTCSVP